jgi:CDP-glucose 4,6-dehydratase
MKKSIIKNNILVTGGYGILGCHLVNFLSNDINNNIYLLDRNSKSKKLLSLNIPKKIKIINGNFNKYKSLLSIIKNKKINIKFHLGAITQVIDAYKSPIETFRTNIIGTINIL